MQAKAYILTCILTPLLWGCNIKAPLDNVWPEANMRQIPALVMSHSRDTFRLTGQLPQGEKIDSITSTCGQIKTPGNNNYLTYSPKTACRTALLTVWSENRTITVPLLCVPPTVPLRPNSFLNNVLFVSISRHPAKMMALWQNIVLPDDFVEYKENKILIFIPKEAKTMHQSAVQIVVETAEGETGLLQVALEWGVPTPNTIINNR